MKIVKRSRMLKNTHVRGILDITVICNKTKKTVLLCVRAHSHSSTSQPLHNDLVRARLRLHPVQSHSSKDRLIVQQ